MLLFHAVLYDHALGCCRSLLPPRSSFWPTFDRLGAAHRAGLALEQSVQAQPEQLTDETLEVIVGGKLAPCLLGVAGLSSLLDDPDRYRVAHETLRHTALAAQHLDDALDWEDDLAHGRVTFLLARAGIGKMAGAEGEPPPTAISDRVQAGWLDVETIKLALAHYDRALDAAQDIPCPVWLAYLHHKRQSAHRILFQMTARRVVGLFDAVGSVEAQTASG